VSAVLITKLAVTVPEDTEHVELCMGLVAFTLLTTVQVVSVKLNFVPVMPIVAPPVPLLGDKVIVAAVVAINEAVAVSPLLPVTVTI
jgi:lipid-A-disaccharide synthase-like uncharacterized protein